MANEAGELDSKDGKAKIEEAMPQPDVHVLAVDDSFLDRKVIERVLKIASYKVTCVESGDKALEVLNSPNNSINLIISDYCMPEMTGFDLLKRIKESPVLKQIPVVMLSSENVPSRIESCLEHGAEEFLLKPIRIADVKRLKSYVCAVNSEVAEQTCDVVREPLVEAVVEKPSIDAVVKQSHLNASEIKNAEHSDVINMARSDNITTCLRKNGLVFYHTQDGVISQQSQLEADKPLIENGTEKTTVNTLDEQIAPDVNCANGDIASDQTPPKEKSGADVTSTTVVDPDATQSVTEADKQLSDTVVDQPSVPCNKRKFSPEGFEAQSPERRPRLSGLAVA